MKKVIFIPLLLIFLFPLWADGLSIEYEALQFSGDLHNAQLIEIESVNHNRGYLKGRVLPHPIYETAGGTRAQRFNFMEHDFYPGEWVIVFEYWNLMARDRVTPGTTAIAIPSGSNSFIFIEDTPWNWQKIEWLVVDGQQHFTSATTAELQNYLYDPDLRFQAYEELLARGVINSQLILDSVVNGVQPDQGLRRMYQFTGLLFQIHWDTLAEDQQEAFLGEALSAMEQEGSLVLRWLLRDTFEQRSYRPLSLYEDYCRIVLNQSLSFEECEPVFYSLVYLLENGTPINELLPLFSHWALLQPEAEDYSVQEQKMEYLFYRLSQRDLRRIFRELTKTLEEQPNPDAHPGLQAGLQNWSQRLE